MLTQEQADAIVSAPKAVSVVIALRAPLGEKLTTEETYPVIADAELGELLLDIERADTPTRKVRRAKIQLRHAVHGPIIRLDLGKDHHNPTCQCVVGDHLHQYRAETGDNWAEPWIGPKCKEPSDLTIVISAFCERFNIHAELRGGLL